MADCGATGTALDRAVAAATGGAASKQAVASLVGHASMNTSAQNMPAAPPTFLSTTSSGVATMAPRTAAPSEVMMQQQQQQQRPAATISGFQQSHPHAMMQAHPHLQSATMPHAMHHQQQRHQMIMMQQQQQMLMMQQQQQQMIMMQQQQQQQHDSSALHANNLKQDDTATAETQHAFNKEPEWHEGLEEEALIEGHEGFTQGATIEELAAAWAQAEAEYEDAVNLGAAYQQQEEVSDVFPYDFETAPQDVATTTTDNRDWMKQAQEAFDAGEVRSAIQYCETELQVNNEHNANAWYLLGKCHAEQDEDGKAIACLERSVEMDPYSPPALLALGVSHVNELNHGRALLYLKNWMTHNPKYAGLELDKADDVYGTASQETAFEQAQRLLLRAMEHDPTDAQVHEALGVVYNVSRDYDAAISSFEKALELSSNQSYSLWNKLGATLANANRSEEALPHYHSALKLRPKYARAWLNMAISHSNLKNYDEAARCYLQTLSLNPLAKHCWSYLRIALSGGEKLDLIPLAAKQDLEAFADYYDFVQYS